MRQFSFIVIFLLLHGTAAGDFELKDPALVNEEEANNPATQAAAEYAVEGAGVKNCVSYRSDRKQNGSMHYINLNWSKGFISGINYIHSQTQGNAQLGTGLDLDALTLWIDNYCLSHPRDTLADASAALADELMN